MQEEKHMFRICTVAIAGFFMAVSTLGATVARADWDKNTSLTDTLPQAGVELADQFFHVQWTATEGRPGRSRITGYVYNDYGQPAVNVRLRISGMDAAGRELKGTTTFPVGDTVPANGRAYFDV